jgi:hypothetical protein
MGVSTPSAAAAHPGATFSLRHDLPVVPCSLGRYEINFSILQHVFNVSDSASQPLPADR